MVNLETVREKLENLLNGTDEELGNIVSPNSDKYFFAVATEGFELKRIYDMQSGKNFIPVFIGSAGGEFNPIPDLNEYSFSVQCQVFFPVRFKADFYTYFTDFIRQVFVGKILTYEEEKVLSNISVPQYGEIESFAVKEFQNFIINTYKMPVEISEQWMSMTFVIYLSGISGDFIYGNDVSFSLTYYEDEMFNITENDIVLAQADYGVSVQLESEQVLGETQSKSLGVVSGYAITLPIYIKNTGFFKTIIGKYHSGELQNKRIDLKTVYNSLDITTEESYIISDATLNIAKGQPMAITLQLARRKE